MPRKHVAIVAAALLAASAIAAFAQNGEDPAGVITPEFFEVVGIARDDALNIRAAASPIGMTIAQVPNGTRFRNLGCGLVGGYLWCKVVAVEDDKLIGWAPGRYLPGAVATDGEGHAAAVDDPSGAPAIVSDTAKDGLMGDATFEEPGAEEETSPLATGAVAGTGEVEVPEGMGLPGIIQRPYSADAKGRVVSLPDAIVVGSAPASDGAAAPTAVAAATPKAAAVDEAFDATAEIPCARYLGQPMTMCHAGVDRVGQAEASVTVNWPDGGQRVIRFRAGRVEGSDSAQPVNTTREADLNMIRVGKTERFEITDALAFGG